ncbi:MAG: hypothetical protein JXC33_12810 [Deltaproteobacteria bacterium]|nr:hypothetical protein [Deltaproteobacteria bacterium]
MSRNEMNRQYGIDIFMSLNACSGVFRVCQAGLGAKIHNAGFPKLGKMLEEVVHTLFSTLLKYRSQWLDESLHQCYERNEAETTVFRKKYYL